MGRTLDIERTSPTAFWHVDNGDVNSRFNISDFEVSIDGLDFNIVEKDGATRYTYKVSDITITDTYGGGTTYNYTDPQLLRDKLEAILYTPYLTDQQQIQTTIFRVGDMLEIDVDAPYMVANFDSAGIGINERVGWKIRYGRGRFKMPYGGSFTILGSPGFGGNSSVTITNNELPDNGKPITRRTPTSIGVQGGSFWNFSEGDQGGGQPLNILNPYEVILNLVRVTDLIIYGNGTSTGGGGGGGTSFRKFVLWDNGNSRSIPVDAGVVPNRVTINEVDIYPELTQYTQAAPGADIVISATVLFDDQSRILITN